MFDRLIGSPYFVLLFYDFSSLGETGIFEIYAVCSRLFCPEGIYYVFLLRLEGGDNGMSLILSIFSFMYLLRLDF